MATQHSDSAAAIERINSENCVSGDSMATQHSAAAIERIINSENCVSEDSMAASDDVDVFVKNYYKDLVLSPQSLYGFYKDCSTVGRPDSNGKLLSVTTVEAINHLITSTDYSALNVEIKAVDSQASYYNGVIVVCVSGSITFKNNSGTRTSFTQFFLLAPQERGYFVLNDVVTYKLDEKNENLVEYSIKPNSNPVSEPEPVVNFQPLAEAQAENGARTEIVPPVAADGVHENDMPQSEVPQESAIEHFQKFMPKKLKKKETPVAVQEEETPVVVQETPVAVQEEDADAAQNGGPAKTPVVVQEAPKESYASILNKKCSTTTECCN